MSCSISLSMCTMPILCYCVMQYQFVDVYYANTLLLCHAVSVCRCVLCQYFVIVSCSISLSCVLCQYFFIVSCSISLSMCTMPILCYYVMQYQFVMCTMPILCYCVMQYQFVHVYYANTLLLCHAVSVCPGASNTHHWDCRSYVLLE